MTQIDSKLNIHCSGFCTKGNFGIKPAKISDFSMFIWESEPATAKISSFSRKFFFSSFAPLGGREYLRLLYHQSQFTWGLWWPENEKNWRWRILRKINKYFFPYTFNSKNPAETVEISIFNRGPAEISGFKALQLEEGDNFEPRSTPGFETLISESSWVRRRTKEHFSGSQNQCRTKEPRPYPSFLLD